MIKFRTFTVLKADDKGNLPARLQVFPKGTYNTLPYGPMLFDDANLQQFIDNFHAGETRNEVPIDFDHEFSGLGGRAGGWIADLELDDAGLWMIPRWNSLGKELVADEQYKYISPEWSFDYQDPQNSTFHGAVLIAASLVNKPLFRDMNEGGVTLTASEARKKGLLFASDGKDEIDPLTGNPKIMLLFSQETKQTTMPTTQDILNKPAAERKPEEVEALAKATDLTAEQTAQLEKEKTDAAAATKEAEDKAAKEKEEAEAKAKEEADAKAKQEADDAAKTAAEKGGKVLTAAEYETFKANNLKLAKMEAAEKMATFKAHEKGGKLLPKSMELAVDFYLTADEKGKASFVKFIESLPEQKLVAGEAGDKGTNDHLTASEEVDKLIKEAKEADKVSKTENAKEMKAQEKIEKENPDLWKQYKEELKGK